MAKKGKKHEEHVDESWLIPYADILTLLLALFIVLFAASQVDQKKLTQMAQSFQVVLQGGSGILSSDNPAPMDEVDVTPPSMEDNTGSSNSDADQSHEAFKKEMEDLKKLQSEFDAYIQKNGLSLNLKTELTDRGLMITILDNALFESGSAEVRKDSIKLAKEISRLIVTKPPRETMISGHTDNVPISNGEFRSNWDLSSMRAINFMKIMLENKQNDPKNFSATGFGEYRPVDKNTTSMGKQHNRRVEVLILPNYRDNDYAKDVVKEINDSSSKK